MTVFAVLTNSAQTGLKLQKLFNKKEDAKDYSKCLTRQFGVKTWVEEHELI